MRNRIKEIMKGVFDIESVSDDISQTSCNNWDSLRHLNLIIELEEDLMLMFEPEEIAKMKSLEEILDVINIKEK